MIPTLLAYGEWAQDKGVFTPDPAADKFVRNDPLAFLVGVLFDQHIPAERAWAAPWELLKRLGHWDIKSMRLRPYELYDAVAAKPALHRYVKNMTHYLEEALYRVERDFGGWAGAVWHFERDARTVRENFLGFKGIGQKKANMAVEILARDFGYDYEHLDAIDVAVDVHLRRVMVRTGLSERDDIVEHIEAARRLHPNRPGQLDYPIWLVGRNWCFPKIPLCSKCVLQNVCPRVGVEEAA